jgi:F0F1-type ATP synthase alpha subunit
MLKTIEDFLKDEISDLDLREIKNEKLTQSKITEILEKSLPDAKLTPEILEVGEVVYIGDGICKIVGLTNARIDDVLRVKTEGDEVLVLVLGISNDIVESVVLGVYFSVK